MSRLSFQPGNAKLKQPGLYTFSLPAGWSCPGALECLAKADRNTGRIIAMRIRLSLTLHGTQPKGSEAAAALSALKRQGHKGYSRKAA